MKTLLSIGLPLFVLLLFGASMWYTADRIQYLFGLKALWPIRIAVIIIVVGSAGTIIGTAQSANTWIGILDVTSGYVFTFYFFLVVSLLILHLLQTIWNMPLILSGSLAILFAFAVTGFGAFKANHFAVTTTEIPMPKLKEGVVVMLISDVHIGHHRGRQYLSKIVEETNRLKPDLVLITGDLIDSKAAFLPEVLAPLKDFEAPTYFVGGNHEQYVDPQKSFEMFSHYGINILHNTIAISNGLQIIGLDYMNADETTFDMHPSDNKNTIKSILAELSVDKDKPSILLHHSPVGAQYVMDKGVDLMLSGHTHAGQMFPFTLLTDLIFPFNAGLHDLNQLKVFVSQGAGTFLSRIRLGTSNEINLLNLSPVHIQNIRR